MDCKEFDRLAAEYAEGLLAPEVKEQMDAHRAVCQLCNELALASESVFMALNEAPLIKAPAGFSNCVMAAVALEEKRIAMEQLAYNRMMKRAYTAAAALAGIFGTVWYIWFKTSMIAPLEQASANLESAYLGRWLGFLNECGRLMNTPVPLPGFDSGAPALYVGAAVMFAGTMLWLWTYQRKTAGCTI